MKPAPTYVYSSPGKREVWGAFAQDKLEYSDWFEVIGGLRYDPYKLESDDGDTESDDGCRRASRSA